MIELNKRNWCKLYLEAKGIFWNRHEEYMNFYQGSADGQISLMTYEYCTGTIIIEQGTYDGIVLMAMLEII